MRLLILLFVLCSSSAYAAVDELAIHAMLSSQNSGYDEQQIRNEIAKGCDEAGDMALCAWYNYFRADVRLNDSYSKAMRWLEEPAAKDALRDAQRAWIAYREASCRFETVAWDGGSFRRVAIASCWEGMTKQRTKELKAVLTCKGEDCPR